MKLTFMGALRALAACSGALWFTGCEVEAEDQSAETNASTVATNSVSAPGTPATNSILETNIVANPPGAHSPATNSVALTETNAAGTNITNTQTVVLNEVPPSLPSNLQLSPAVQEIVKLAQAGVSETVMLLFVEKSPSSFDLDAAEIVYLNDIGVPQTVIAAMLNHDGNTLDVDSVLSTNAVAEASVPDTNAAPAIPPAVVQSQPVAQGLEVSSNYVADPNYQVPVVQQQPVVVQQQPVVVQQPVIVEPAVTHSYFYSSLAPYGTWVEVPDYGWCWRPTISVVHRGWRPYLHGGRWLHSDHGWYWHSDYSWGWAPFHYGRWYAAPRLGWVWVPGYKWGPSWVTWRYSGAYCGWAPLPPHCDVRPGVGFTYWGRHVGFGFHFGLSHHHYTFIPTRRFHAHRYGEHVIPTEKTVNIYNNSTVVNNYIVGNNNTIINQGISRDRIVNYTRTEIPRVNVRETPVTPNGPAVQPDRIHRTGSEMIVYRPQTPPNAAALAQQSATRREEARRQSGAPVAGANLAGQPGAVTGSRFGQEVRRGETAGAGSTTSQGQTVRPQVIARTEPPALPKPEPVRPEAPPTFTPRVQASRAVQEARSRTQTPSGRPIGGIGRSEATPGLQRQGIVTPTTPQVVTPSTTRTPTTSRFGSTPAMPPSISGQTLPGANPPSISGRPVGPAMPPSISGQAVPGTPGVTTRPSTPSTTVTPGSRFGSTRPAAPPSISGHAVPGAPTRTESRFGNSGFGSSATTQSVPSTPTTQPRIQQTPISNSRFGSTPPAVAPAPAVIPRTETLNRQNVAPPVQAAPPRVVTPSTPSRFSGPTVTPRAPSVPSAPATGNSRFGGTPVRPTVNPGSISGNSRFGSAPPASAPQVIQRAPTPAPAARPSTPTQTPSSRGRVEIGR